jgi:hypothetical protein
MRWLLKRWWFWGGVGFVLVSLGTAYLVIPIEEGRISQATCDKIQLGWPREQVEDLLGPAFYRKRDCGSLRIVKDNGYLKIEQKTGTVLSSSAFMLWKDDDGTIAIAFEDGRVSQKGFATPSLWFRIERRLWALWP